MSQPGKFIVSFDCEGKWGMADHLTPALEAQLTNRAIEGAYTRILEALERRALRATFAFVGTFTLAPDEYPEFRDQLRDAQVRGHSWLATFRRDAAAGRFEGWLVPEALRRVQAAGCHEVGTHGFSHVPLDEHTSDEALFRHELELVRRLAARQKWTPRTIIFPRNQIGHVDRLAEFGVIGYREILWPQSRGPARRLRSLLAEFGVGADSQPGEAGAPPVAIPSGHILNFWHNRSRRLVPRGATRRRWRTMMEHAARTGGTVHLWSHPHNFISDPDLVGVFDAILEDAAAFVRAGSLRNLTQEEFCRAPAP